MSSISDEENLWGDLPTDTNFETPLSILRAQATLLPKISGGLLDGRIRRFSPRNPKNVGHELQVVVPALGNYSVAIVSVIQPIIIYPAIVYSDVMNQEFEAEDSQEVKRYLKEVLQSKQVQNIILGLIVQAREAGDGETATQTRKSIDE